MANEFVYDLKTPETTWKGYGCHYFADGTVMSKAGSITSPTGPHGLFWVLDTVMYKIPEGTDIEKEHMPHYHKRGYETFFVDSGKLYLFINGQKVLCQKGDIVQLQAGQTHGMAFIEEVKWRGTYHDFETYPEAREVGLVNRYMPETKDDPELMQHYREMDNIKVEPFVSVEVPAEQCSAVKNPSRPHAAYEFEGCTIKVMVERWENGGVKELCLAEMEPGFCVEWDKYPALREMLYIRSGKVKFNVMGKEFIADDECIVDLPRFAPRSMEVLEKADVYDFIGQTQWSMFLQNYASLKKFAPERFNDAAEIDALKKKFDVCVKSIGMKK